MTLSMGKWMWPVAAAVAMCAAVPADASKPEAWLGVSVRDVDEETAKAFGLKDASGALVTAVAPRSPARKAGLRTDDLIVEFDGNAVKDAGQLSDLVADKQADSVVKVKVLRGGEKATFDVTLASRRKPDSGWEWGLDDWLDSHPRMRSFTFRLPEFWRSTARGRLGVRVMNLNDDLSAYFQTKKGALVLEVDEDSPANTAGIKPGDVVVEVAGAAVEDREDLADSVEAHKKAASIKLKVFRHGKSMDLVVNLSPKRRHHTEDEDEETARTPMIPA